MASPQRRESPPPAKKRCKSPEFDSVLGPKVAKNTSEFGPQTSAGPRKSLSKFFVLFKPPVKFFLCLFWQIQDGGGAIGLCRAEPADTERKSARPPNKKICYCFENCQKISL